MRDILGLYYPRHTTKDGHRSPFEFISDVFFEREDKMLMRACRGGGKTITFAAAYLLDTIFKPKYAVVHIGGSEQQSKQGYSYYAGDPKKEGEAGFLRWPAFEGHLSESTLTRTTLTNGSRLEIRTGGSKKSVSGPHPNMLGVDELDHIKMDILDTALLMPISRGRYAAQTLMGSSQYAYYGTLQSLVTSAASRKIKLYEYDLFDVMTSCGRNYPSQCGEECPFYLWTNPFSGEVEELCGGRGTKSDGFYSYQDAINKYLMTFSIEEFSLQMLLLRGTSQGMVYSTFNPKTHVKDFPPPELDISNWRCYAGVDLWTRGRVTVLAQSPYVLPNGKRMTWVIDEWVSDNSSPSKIREAASVMREKIKQKYGLIIAPFWMESAAGEATESEWRLQKLPGRIMAPEKRNVLYGISQLRDAFLDAQNNVSIYIDPKCTNLITSLSEVYHCKRKADGKYDRDIPDEEGSDSADALRYAYVGGPIGSAHLPDQPTKAGWWDMGGGQLSRLALY